MALLSLRGRVRQFARVLLAAGVLALLLIPTVRSLDRHRFMEVLSAATFWPAAGAVVLGLGGCMGMATLRLASLLAALPRTRAIRLRRLYVVYLASTAAQHLLPSPAAKILRTIHLSRQYGYTLSDTTAAHVLERAIDAVALSGCVALWAALGDVPSWMERPIALFTVASALGIILLAAFARRPMAFEDAPRALRSRPWSRIVEFLTQTLSSLRKLRALSMWLIAAGWSCLSEIANVVTVGLVLLSVGQPSSVGVWLTAALTARLSAAVPLTPGQIGIQEGSIALALGAVGVEPNHAMAAALLYRAVHSLPIIMLGGLALRDVIPELMIAARGSQGGMQ